MKLTNEQIDTLRDCLMYNRDRYSYTRYLDLDGLTARLDYQDGRVWVEFYEKDEEGDEREVELDDYNSLVRMLEGELQEQAEADEASWRAIERTQEVLDLICR